MREIDQAPFGIVGLETLIPITVTSLIEPGHLTLARGPAQADLQPGPASGDSQGDAARRRRRRRHDHRPRRALDDRPGASSAPRAATRRSAAGRSAAVPIPSSSAARCGSRGAGSSSRRGRWLWRTDWRPTGRLVRQARHDDCPPCRFSWLRVGGAGPAAACWPSGLSLGLRAESCWTWAAGDGPRLGPGPAARLASAWTWASARTDSWASAVAFAGLRVVADLFAGQPGPRAPVGRHRSPDKPSRPTIDSTGSSHARPCSSSGTLHVRFTFQPIGDQRQPPAIVLLRRHPRSRNSGTPARGILLDLGLRHR